MDIEWSDRLRRVVADNLVKAYESSATSRKAKANLVEMHENITGQTMAGLRIDELALSLVVNCQKPSELLDASTVDLLKECHWQCLVAMHFEGQEASSKIAQEYRKALEEATEGKAEWSNMVLAAWQQQVGACCVRAGAGARGTGDGRGGFCVPQWAGTVKILRLVLGQQSKDAGPNPRKPTSL